MEMFPMFNIGRRIKHFHMNMKAITIFTECCYSMRLCFNFIRIYWFNFCNIGNHISHPSI